MCQCVGPRRGSLSVTLQFPHLHSCPFHIDVLNYFIVIAAGELALHYIFPLEILMCWMFYQRVSRESK